MREQRWGKIVNIGSMGGRLTFPGGGLYHATKYAVEAISDALRFEVRGFGVDVILIEPGLIVTGFGDAATATVPADGDGPYAHFNEAVAQADHGRVQGPDVEARRRARGGRQARSPARSTSGRPKPRYPVTPSAHLMITQRRLDARTASGTGSMRTQFPTPKP